jgi:hypothetical protein
MADELLEGGVGEGVELHLDHGPQPVHGHADRGAQDARLRQRRVEQRSSPNSSASPLGDPEDAAQRADVLAEDMDGRVGGHGVAQRPAEGLGHGGGLALGGGGHRSPSASSSARSCAACSRSWLVLSA